MKYNNRTLSMGDMFPDPQLEHETVDSAEPYIYFTLLFPLTSYDKI